MSTQLHSLLASISSHLAIDILEFAELLLPFALERSRDDAVVRIDRLVATLRELGFVLRTFEAQSPLAIELLFLSLGLRRNGGTQTHVPRVPLFPTVCCVHPVAATTAQHDSLKQGFPLSRCAMAFRFIAMRSVLSRIFWLLKYCSQPRYAGW